MSFSFFNRFKKILIVEDDHALQKALELKFTNKGFKVITTNTGRDVLKIVAEEHPAGIILDLILPAHDGIDILRNLRSSMVEYTKPVIILSNLPGSSDLRTDAESLNAQYYNKANTPIDTVVNALIQQL